MIHGSGPSSPHPVHALSEAGHLWGLLTAEGAYEVLFELSRSRRTGLFEVYAGERVYGLALRRGAPIHARPGVLPWVLGDVMGHLGLRDSRSELGLGGAQAFGRGEPVGKLLIQSGFVTPFDVDRALKEQIRLRAQEFLPLTQGRYRFWSGGSQLKGLPRQPDRWTAGELIDVVRRSGGRAEALRCLLNRLEGSRDPFVALGIEGIQDREAARTAFRRLAKDHHPDRLGGNKGAVERLLHRRIFQAALKAYERAWGVSDERYSA